MAKPSSDSPTTRKLVRAFLDFLNSVELSSDADSESLDVAKDCLETVFNLTSVSDEPVPPNVLIDLFSTWEIHEKLRPITDPLRNKASSSASNQNGVPAEDPKETEVLTRDELFGRMYAALDKINFFKISNLGEEDSNQIQKATQIFDEAYAEIKNSEGKKKLCVAELAEFFKTKGNKSMQSKQYIEAIELYNCAIALCNRNAVYYCNRAAAYTLIKKNNEAINDCLKSIEIDPNYSKAFSRLGSAYFELGNFHDALIKGYSKALMLDPDNKNIQENIKVTKLKIAEQARSQGQNSNPFSSDFINNIMRGVSANSSINVDMNNIFGNNQGHESNPEQNEGLNGESEPEIRIDDNIQVNIGDHNESVRVHAALRSVLNIFSDQMGPDMHVNLGSEIRPDEN